MTETIKLPKITFDITRTYDGMKGHVAVQGGVYSEGKIHTYKSKIQIDGEWYPIPEHIDDYGFKYLIQGIDIRYFDRWGSQRKDQLRWKYRDLPIKVIYDYANAWDYTPKDGDVFDGYGIELDANKLSNRKIIDYTIVWSKGLNIKTTSDDKII